jgi:uncharacterized protein (DUF58 family)
MRITVRGVGVAIVGVAAVGMADLAGARALNALAAPAFVALLAGAVQVIVAGTPTVERADPPAGFPDETRAVELSVDGGGVARIRDSLPSGVTAADATVDATLPATVGYETRLTERGVWELGPSTVAVSDLLGLFVRTARPPATAEAIVYPAVYDMRDHEAFASLFQQGAADDRQAFDTIREYAPGDPLRDVHWKSSAKASGNDLVVKQFVGDDAEEEFSVVAEATPGHADEMAAAAASVALLAARAGLSVAVTCPAGDVPAGRGDTHRRHVLELLARTGAGRIDQRSVRRADAAITADDDGVTVTVDDQSFRLGRVESGDRSQTDAGDAIPRPPAAGEVGR